MNKTTSNRTPGFNSLLRFEGEVILLQGDNSVGKSTLSGGFAVGVSDTTYLAECDSRSEIEESVE